MTARLHRHTHNDNPDFCMPEHGYDVVIMLNNDYRGFADRQIEGWVHALKSTPDAWAVMKPRRKTPVMVPVEWISSWVFC